MRAPLFLCFAVLVLGLSTKTSRVQAQQISLPYEWANSGGGSADDTGRGVALDNAGNVYVTGRFTGTSSFGAQTLNGYAASQDIFLVKYNSQGVVQWAKSAGGAGDDSGIGIAVNAAGEVYITGYFNDVCAFGSGTANLTSYGSYDLFLAKYSPSGTLLWARSAGGNGDDEGLGVSVTPQGDAAVVGFFDNVLTIDPGTPLTAAGRHACLIRYSDQGTPIAAQTVGGPTGTHARGVSFDASGNVYVTGNTVHNGNNDGFLTKISANGATMWTRFVGGANFDRSIGVVADAYGGVLIAGLFEGTATADSTTITSSGDYDAFLAKYDTAGILSWVRTAGGSGQDYAINLAIDQYGNPLITGFFTGTAMFGGTVLSGTTSFATSIFRAWYDWQGNMLGAEAAGSSAAAIGYGVAVDLPGNTYLTGNFNTSVQLAPFALVSSGASDVFVGKVASSLSRLHPPRTPTALSDLLSSAAALYPNPAVAGARIVLPSVRESATSNVQLYDVQGRLVQSATLSNSRSLSAEFTLGQHAPGLYLARISSVDRNQTVRLLIR